MRARLRSQGYTTVHKLAKFGPPGREIYSGEASQGTRRFKINVNGRTGRVTFRRAMASPATVLTLARARARARAQGYNPIYKIRKLGVATAGHYQMEADKGGQRFILNMNAKTGKIWFTKRIGPATGGGGAAAGLTPAQMRAQLATAGFVNITKFRKRKIGTRDLYFLEAERAGRRWSIIAQVSDGKIVRRRNIGVATGGGGAAAGLTPAQMRAQLATAGFVNITKFRKRKIGTRDLYFLEAERAGRRWSIIAQVSDGKIVRRRNIGVATGGGGAAAGLTPAQMRAQLATAGFVNITKFRKRKIGTRDLYFLEAERAGRRWSIIAQVSDGKIVRRRNIGVATGGGGAAAGLTPAQMRAKLATAGFTNIAKFTKRKIGSRDFYVLEANQAGRRWQIIAQVSDGKIRRKRNIGVATGGGGAAAGLTPAQMRAKLATAGFTNIAKFTRRKIGGRDFYVLLADQAGRRWQIIAQVSDGKIRRKRNIGVATGGGGGGGGGLTPAQMKAKLATAGFTNIAKFTRRKISSRDFYVLEADQAGRGWQIIAQVSDGKIRRKRNIGVATGGGGTGAILTVAQVRASLRTKGFRGVTNVRLNPLSFPPVYTAVASRGGRRFSLQVHAQTGKVLGRRPAGAAAGLTKVQMTRILRSRGFRNIINMMGASIGGRRVWIAQAQRGRGRFTVVADARTGATIRTVPLPRTPLSRRQILAKLSLAGFTTIRKLVLVRRAGRPVYTAEADRAGRRVAIVVGAFSARLLASRPVGTAGPAIMTPAQLRAALRGQGFRTIRGISRGSIGRRVVYSATATRFGRRFQIVADGRTGRVINRSPIAAPILTAGQIRLALIRRGFVNVRNLVRTRVGSTLVYLGQAERRGRRLDIVVDARTARLLQAQPVTAGILTPRQILSALRALGWQRVRNLRLINRGGRQMYLADASRGGRDFKLVVRARDARVMSSVAQTAPLMTPRQIRLALTLFGYWQVRDIKLINRRGRQFYQLKARRNGRALRLLVRANTGAVVSSRPDGPTLLTSSQISASVAQAGYRRIRVLRQTGGSGRPTFIVRGQKGGKIWLLVVSAVSGNILNRRVLRSLQASPGDISVALSRWGYAHVSNVQLINAAGRRLYFARGWKDGALWRVGINLAGTRVLSRQRIGGRMNEAAVEQRLVRAGYRKVDILRWRPGSRAGTYAAVAWQGQVKYRLRVNALDGNVMSRRQINQSQTPVEIIRRLARLAGFHYLNRLTWLGSQGVYRGEAWRKGYR